MNKNIGLRFPVIAILFILFFTLAYLWANYTSDDEQKVNENYFNSFNEYYEGHIYDIVEEFGTHTCMLFLKLDSSTVNNFDIRDTTEYYHTVIKSDSAEVIERIRYGDVGEPENWIRVGDKIIFDGKIDSMYLYHNDTLIERWKPHISTFDLINIRNHHRF